jgi:adenine-specific DNA glycosylase
MQPYPCQATDRRCIVIACEGVNQALMELGATVCTPKSPSCAACPLQADCVAWRLQKEAEQTEQGTAAPVTAYPGTKVKAPPREETVAVCVVERRVEQDGTAQLLLVRRPATGLLAGLWEFPSVVVPAESTADHRRSAMDEYLSERLGVRPSRAHTLMRAHVGEQVHVFSHVRCENTTAVGMLAGPSVQVRGAALRKLVVLRAWGSPTRRVGMAASPVHSLKGAGRVVCAC